MKQMERLLELKINIDENYIHTLFDNYNKKNENKEILMKIKNEMINKKNKD